MNILHPKLKQVSKRFSHLYHSYDSAAILLLVFDDSRQLRLALHIKNYWNLPIAFYNSNISSVVESQHYFIKEASFLK